jgi:16S rRNA processing protein RimM
LTESLKRELAIGVTLRAHGVRGHIKVRSLSGETGHFAGLQELRLLRQGREVLKAAVEEVSADAGGDTLRVKLAGIDTPEQARDLCGCEVWVGRDRAAPLQPGEYYLADLVGCRVLGPQGAVGSVSGVINAGAGDVLEVRADDGRTFLVPFREGFVGEVDVEAGTVRLAEDAPPEKGAT